MQIQGLLDAVGPKIFWTLAALFLGFFCARLFGFFGGRYLRRHSHLPSIFSLMRLFGWRSQFLFTFLSLRVLLPLMRFEPVLTKRLAIWLEVVSIIALWIFCAKLIKLVKMILYARYDMTHPNNLRERKVRTQVQYIEKVILIFLGFIAFALILISFEGVRKIGRSLIASAGVIGVIVGFAAQRTLGNLISGFQIAFTQPIRLDDVVVIEGEWGKVEEINLSYVVVRTWDNRALVLPIHQIVEKPFQNWTRTGADLIGTVLLYLDYSLDLDKLRAKFQEIIQTSPLWDRKLALVQVTDATEKSMVVRILVSARNASEAFDLRCFIREELLRYVQSVSPSALPALRVSVPDSQNQPAARQEVA